MICQYHNKTFFGVCSNCRKFVCQSCLLEKHLNHPQSITFLQNLLIISYNTCQQLIQLKNIFDEHRTISSIIPDFIDQQRREINTKTLQLLEQQNFDNTCLEFIIFIAKKLVFQEIQQLLNQIHYEQFYDDDQKQHLNQTLLELVAEDDLKYIRIKNYDMYCLLQKSQKNSKALAAYRISLQNLIKRPLFFQNILKKLQYQENFNIESDYHFQTSLARNFYYIKDYDKCIELLANVADNEETLLFKTISFICLEQYSEAENVMKKLIMKTTNQFYCLLLQGVILEGLVKVDQLVKISEILYENNQDSFFQRNLYHVLFVTDNCMKIYQNSSIALQKQPNDYNFLMYKAIACFQLHRYQDVKNIYEKLIELEPKKISGFIIKGGWLLVQQKLKDLIELSTYFYQNFDHYPISQLLQSFILYFRQKYDESFQLFEQTKQNIMTSKQNRLQFDIMLLVRNKKIETAYQRLMNNYENSKQFYHNVSDFCFEVYQGNFGQKAIEIIDRLSGNGESEAAKKLYPIVKGKLLLDLGIWYEFQDYILQSEKFLFTQKEFDSCGQPHIHYFKGQALSYQSKIREATIHLETTYKNKQNFNQVPVGLCIMLSVNQILQGKFDQALHYIQEDTYFQKNYQNLIQAICLWVRGSLKDAYELLMAVTTFFPQSNLIISWILKEQNEFQKAENQLLNIAKQFPVYQQFLQRDYFLLQGHCETFMKNNWVLFQNLDNKRFFATKFVSYFIDLIGYPNQDKIYPLIFGCTLASELECQIYSQTEKKKQELIMNYPFV